MGQKLTTAESLGLSPKTWKQLLRECGHGGTLALYAVDPEGQVIHGRAPCRRHGGRACQEARCFALREAVRWGEPTVTVCPAKRLLWAVPLMGNQIILGGLIASATERRVIVGKGKHPPLDLRRACTDLRSFAERKNLTNAAALQLQRQRHHEEKQRAYELHALKDQAPHGIRELYLRLEPALFSAIRAQDRREARDILNRILLAILQHAGSRLDLVKSFFLELVVSMCRTAVEAGGDPEALLGANYTNMAALSGIDTEEELSGWLRQTLEHLMDRIHESRQRDSAVLLFDAIAFMERHCCERISRDDAARAAHLSPSHFSTLLRKESGTTFTHLLNRMRVDRAAELLSRSDRPLSVIALMTGFRDQSYFTKVFKRYRKLAPLQYRRQTAGLTAEPPRPR